MWLNLCNVVDRHLYLNIYVKISKYVETYYLSLLETVCKNLLRFMHSSVSNYYLMCHGSFYIVKYLKKYFSEIFRVICLYDFKKID